MDNLSNDAVAKIVEFLGKDGQPFSKTSKRNWEVTQKARYQMLTHGYEDAEHQLLLLEEGRARRNGEREGRQQRRLDRDLPIPRPHRLCRQSAQLLP